MLSAYETGKHRPSLDTTERVLRALDCDVVELTHALQFIDRQDSAADQGRQAAEPGADFRVSDLASFVEGNIGSARLDSAEKEVLGSLLPGVLNLIRYLKS